MVKAQARPGLAPERDEFGALVLDGGEVVLVDTSPALRWIGNGRAIKDNKGNVVKAYEPYYSSIPDYEDEAELVERGVSPLMHYDPLGRLIRTDFPNGTFSKVEFTAWEQTSFDPNDTVLESDWYAARIGYEGEDVALQKERRAAELAAAHANTPSQVHVDTLGRPFLTIAHNKEGAANVFTETKSVMDIQGHVLAVLDARSNTAEARPYGMLGQPLEVLSHDAGTRVHLLDALGQPMRTWDSRDQRFSHTYDTLRRPVDRSVSVDGGSEKLLTRIVYGDLLSTPEDTNHVGKVYRVYDGAGVATTTAFDFKGHALAEERQLVDDKTTQPDWTDLLAETTIATMATAASPLLDAETFSASSQRDALNRVLVAISPDDSEVPTTKAGRCRRSKSSTAAARPRRRWSATSRTTPAANARASPTARPRARPRSRSIHYLMGTGKASGVLNIPMGYTAQLSNGELRSAVDVGISISGASLGLPITLGVYGGFGSSSRATEGGVVRIQPDCPLRSDDFLRDHFGHRTVNHLDTVRSIHVPSHH